MFIVEWLHKGLFVDFGALFLMGALLQVILQCEFKHN